MSDEQEFTPLQIELYALLEDRGMDDGTIRRILGLVEEWENDKAAGYAQAEYERRLDR